MNQRTAPANIRCSGPRSAANVVAAAATGQEKPRGMLAPQQRMMQSRGVRYGMKYGPAD